jgi:RNA polymerase sigma factor (sigma-70 family)
VEDANPAVRENKVALGSVSIHEQPATTASAEDGARLGFVEIDDATTRCFDCWSRRGERAMNWRSLKELESDMAQPGSVDFEQVIMPHFNAAYNLARWLVADATLAEDIVQDAMLRAFRYFGSYKGGDGKSWLLRIVRNVAYSALATRRRRGTTSIDDAGLTADGEPLAMQIADPADDPEETLVRLESFARLDQAMAALPAELRECLVLHELEELSYKEVAHVTGVPIGTVTSRLWRARQALMRSQGAEQ